MNTFESLIQNCAIMTRQNLSIQKILREGNLQESFQICSRYDQLREMCDKLSIPHLKTIKLQNDGKQQRQFRVLWLSTRDFNKCIAQFLR